jgi:hypothetical protein
MIIQLGFSLSLFYCNAGIWYRIGFMLASSYVKQVQSIEHARSKPNRHTRSGIRIFGEYTSSLNQSHRKNIESRLSTQVQEHRQPTFADPPIPLTTQHIQNPVLAFPPYPLLFFSLHNSTRRSAQFFPEELCYRHICTHQKVPREKGSRLPAHMTR